MTKQIEVKENELYFAKTHPNAIIPTKRREDAGWDVYTVETNPIIIPPNETRNIETGIAIACHPKYFPKFFDKSGMGSKGLIVGAGVGDSGFRGGYLIPIINTSHDNWFIMTNQKQEDINEATHFDLEENKFVVGIFSPYDSTKIPMKNIIVKDLSKSFVQFVMIEVPKFNEQEITYEELKQIPSERGEGRYGSTGK